MDTSQLYLLLGPLEGMAQALEEGRSRAPLAGRIDALKRQIKKPVLILNVLAFNHEAASKFIVSALPMLPVGFFSSSLSINDGKNQLSLGRKVEDFANAQELVNRISALGEDDLKHHVKSISISGLDGYAPTTFIIADASKLALLDLVEFNRVVTHSHAVCVAAPLDYVLNDEERTVLWQVLNRMSFLSVVALPPTGNQTEGARWHQESVPAHLKMLPSVKVESELSLSIVRRVDDPARALIVETALLAKVGRTLDLFKQQLDEKLHYLACCEESDDFILSLIENDPALTKELDGNKKVLDQLSESLDAFSKDLQDKSKASLVGKGPFFHMVESELDRISADDIEKEKVHNVHKLTISSDVFGLISDGLLGRLRKHFKQENHHAIDELTQLVSKARLQLQGWPEGLSLAGKERDLIDLGLERGQDHLDFKIRYKGEMPQRGILKRLGEGRKAMFMVLMMFSIFGSMLGFNYRNYAIMGVFFILLFLGGTIYTYFSWRKDDEFKMEKEVEKARDQLHSEYVRALGEIERNRVKKITDEVMQFVRKQKQLFDAWQRKSADQLKTRLTDAKDNDKQKKSMLKAEQIKFGRMLVDISQLQQAQNEYQARLMAEEEKLGLG